MIKKILSTKYGIDVEEETRVGHYEACISKGKLYTIVPVGNIEEEELTERDQIAAHIYQIGDKHVSMLLESKEGSKHTEMNEQLYCVLPSFDSNNMLTCLSPI